MSLFIVVLLGGIGTAIWIKGHHFDPGLYALRSSALQPAEAAVAKAAPAEHGETAAGEASPSGESASAPAANAPKPVGGEPMEIAVAGIKPMGETEFYSADNLFEKIDGRSGAYLEFKCEGLRCRSFGVTAAKGSYVDVYEFKMDSAVNAFGIFALERDPKGTPINFAPDGYSGEIGFYFRQGAYYIQVIASDALPKTMEYARAIAENRFKAFPEDNTGIDARRHLPAAYMIAESVGFVQEDAQGQSFLKNVFQATYDFEGGKLPFFLMVAKPEEAAAAWKKYNAFCTRFGKAVVLPEVNGAQLFQAESFGKWRVIFQKDGEIGGVFDAADGEKARHFVEGYLKGDIK